MKKFLLSATLLVAFSLTSFAADKEVLNKSEVKTEVKTQLQTESDFQSEDKAKDICVTIEFRWADGESDGEGGMILTFHKYEITVCV